jgi:hypothetical protein
MKQRKINWRGWLATWLQDRRRLRLSMWTPPPVLLVLSSDGHGHLTWTCTVDVVFGFNIYHSNDGVNWDKYDAQYPNLFYRDCSGFAGFYRISRMADEDGNPMLPYSNAVYSDGL